MEQRPYTAIQVANSFIQLSLKEDNPITPLKLIKLCYIAQGVSFVINNTPIFLERCEAWKYGPVVPEVYAEFKKYGREKIYALGGMPVGVDDKGRPIYSSVDPNDSKAMSVLTVVWNGFKDKSAEWLSDWTHREGAAWDRSKRNDKGGFYNPTITPDLLKDEFRKIVSMEK